MATYKVIQDIEAEDKFVGPLTLRQFIFAMIGVFFGYLCVFSATEISPWGLIVFLPPSLLGFFLAIPWSKDQPTEVWVLAKIRFRFKPKVRIWNQSGLQDLVTITAPKKIEKVLTNNLSQTEIRSRLKALAETIDSRGWAVKNAEMPEANNMYYPQQDRLISPSMIPQSVPDVDTESIPDMMDEDGTPVSAQFDQMIQAKGQARKEEMVDRMERVRSGQPIHDSRQVVAEPEIEMPPINSISAQDEITLKTGVKAKKIGSRLAKTEISKVRANSDSKIKQDTITEKIDKAQAVTTPVRPDILGLAQNSDLNVATIARQSHENDSENEVVISLR